MKKIIAKVMLFSLLSVSLVGFAIAADTAIHNPANDTNVGKLKKGDQTLGCTCLFHEIEEFVKGLFS